MPKKIKSSGLLFLWVTVLVFLIDRFAKNWVMMHLLPGESLRVLPVFNLTLAYNTGAAFSFLSGASGWQNIFLGGLAFFATIFILVWLYKLPFQKYWMNTALCLVLGGALGNVWDRILYGYVIDFFDFHLGNWHFAIFNTADSAIFMGAVMLILHWMVFERLKR